VSERSARRGWWFLGGALLLATGLVLVVVPPVVRANRVRVLTRNAQTGGLTFSPEGDTLAFVDAEGIVAVWSWESSDAPRELFEGQRLTHLAFFPDGNSLAACGEDRGVLVKSLSSHDPVRVLRSPGSETTVAPIAFVASGLSLAVPTRQGLEIWSVRDERLVRTLGRGFDSFDGDVAFSPAGDKVAECHQGATQVFSLGTGEILASRSCFSPALAARSGDFLVAEVDDAKNDQKLRVVELLGKRTLATLELGHRGALQWTFATALSPDGELVAVSIGAFATDNVLSGTPPSEALVQLWSVRDGRKVATFTGPRDELCTSLAFAPSRDVLAGSWGREIHVWPFRR
jgi:WD40 repeat protein